MNQSKFHQAVSAMVLAGACFAASPAECGNFYAQADYGRTAIDEQVDVGGTLVGLDDTTSGHRLAIGYDWSKYFSMEAAFDDFGSISAQIPGLKVAAQADGYELGLVFHWPLSDRFALSFRAGYLFWEADTQVAGIRDSDSGDNAFGGLGGAFQATERLAITLDWKKYRLDELDLKQTSVGLRWSFGAGGQ